MICTKIDILSDSFKKVRIFLLIRSENYNITHKISTLQQESLKIDDPVILFQDGEHIIYWLGILEETAFRCNIYLVKDGEEGILIDPGGKNAFEIVKNRVLKVMSLDQITGLLFCHQDPDVAASMPDWLAINSQIQVFSSPRVHVLLRYYQIDDYKSYNVEEKPSFYFVGGHELQFIAAPFLHSPGAFATFDVMSGYLFSGDIWGALDIQSRLVVDNFSKHIDRMDLFNKDYMASNLAARGFVQRVESLEIEAILPQHGSLIAQKDVLGALEYLWDLDCGLDLLHFHGDVQKDITFTSHHALIESSFSFEQDKQFEPIEFDSHDTNDLELKIKLQNTQLVQAFEQATRLAKMKDQALRDLKRTEHSLRESESRLSEAQAIAKLGHWIWDVENEKLVCSDEIYRIFGLDYGSLTTHKIFLDLVHLDDRKYVIEVLERAMNGESPYNLNYRIIRSDGEVLLVHEHIKMTQDSDGKLRQMLGTIHDITELTQMGELLHSKNMLINTIQQLQSQFINHIEPVSMYQGLLDDILKLTESSFGFIAEYVETEEQKTYLKIYALDNLRWSDETRKSYKSIITKDLEIRDLDHSLGDVITTVKSLMTDESFNDSLVTAFFQEYLDMNVFGIPVYHGERLVGQIALADRKNGYNDDLLKYLEPLIVAYGQIIVARHDQIARQKAEEALAKLAKLDGLLGIPNRRSFDEYVSQQYALSMRHKVPLSLILMDVDYFKRFNDYYGHQEGDECLKAIAEIVQLCLRRPSDMVARYGGEEFCCILPGTSIDGALKIVQNIQNKLLERGIEHITSSVSDKITLSMGVSATMQEGEKELSLEELINLADRLLYFAKASGRNTFKVSFEE